MPAAMPQFLTVGSKRLPQRSEAHLTWALITLMTRRLTRSTTAQKAAGRR